MCSYLSALTPTGKGVLVHLSPASIPRCYHQYSYCNSTASKAVKLSPSQPPERAEGVGWTGAALHARRERQALTCPETAGRRTHAWLAYARTPHLTKPCERHNVKTMPTSIIACASAKEEKPKVAFNICNWERTSLEMETGKNIKLNTSHLLTSYTAIKTMYNNVNSVFNKEVLICNET